MTTVSLPGADADWLQSFIIDAARQKLCTKIKCTTCGALEFRTGLMEGVARATGQPMVSEFDLARARVAVSALARVSPEADRLSEMEDAVRLILFEMWRPIGAATAERELEPMFAGNWAGEVLAGMKTDQQARQGAWRRHTENQLRQEQEREERQRAKRERHAERLERKKGRDRLWRERQGQTES